MKICAITMVYRDYWALSQWYAHYSRALGSEHLVIVAHGHDPKISKLCPEAVVITVPRDDLNGFDSKRNRMLNGIQRELEKTYDWIIRTDADELICLNPALHDSFSSLLANRPADAVFGLGLDIVEQSGDAKLTPHESVFRKRSSAVFSGHYSKAWAVRNGTDIDLHGVMVGRDQVESYPYDLPDGVYMAHLKYANIAALNASNGHRRRIARMEGEGLPGKAWRKAFNTSNRFFDRVAAFGHKDWPEALQEATTAQIAKRDTELGLLRSKFIAHKFKTTLPDWFGKPD